MLVSVASPIVDHGNKFIFEVQISFLILGHIFMHLLNGRSLNFDVLLHHLELESFLVEHVPVVVENYEQKNTFGLLSLKVG
jgi:hypothetical protein